VLCIIFFTALVPLTKELSERRDCFHSVTLGRVQPELFVFMLNKPFWRALLLMSFPFILTDAQRREVK